MRSHYLDTRQLEAFAAVVSVGSITGAAKALGLSQPVITRQIQDLETQIGFALLHRSGPRVTPTGQGLAFYEDVEMFLTGLRTISDKAKAIGIAEALPLTVASIPSLATGVLPAAIAAIDETLRPRQLQIQSISAENVVQTVISGTSDVGLASWPVDNAGLDVHWQAEVPCHAVVSRDHKLASSTVLTPADLRDEPLIMAANPYRLRLLIDRALQDQGVVPRSVTSCNATYVSLSMASQGLGIAIVEPFTGAGLPSPDLITIPLSFYVPFRWSVITAIGRPLTPSVAAVIDAIKTTATRTVPSLRVHAAER
jgi:DNA-binding transcriptional LysR family regulator